MDNIQESENATRAQLTDITELDFNALFNKIFAPMFAPKMFDVNQYGKIDDVHITRPLVRVKIWDDSKLEEKLRALHNLNSDYLPSAMAQLCFYFNDNDHFLDFGIMLERLKPDLHPTHLVFDLFSPEMLSFFPHEGYRDDHISSIIQWLQSAYHLEEYTVVYLLVRSFCEDLEQTKAWFRRDDIVKRIAGFSFHEDHTQESFTKREILSTIGAIRNQEIKIPAEGAPDEWFDYESLTS